MEEKIMLLELSAENQAGRYYYASLELPAEEYEIRDALQRIRAIGRDAYIGIDIYNCNILPELNECRLDSTDIDELNFLAKRLVRMPEEQRYIFRGVAQKIVETPADDLVSIKDLINSTYDLDSVMIASNVGTDEQLGQFVIENDLHEDVSIIPEQSRYLLNKRDIGRMQRKTDGGVFVDGHYVVAGDYVPPEIYDGKTLPEAEETDSFVFRLKVGEYPTGGTVETEDDAEWLNLPTNIGMAREMALKHHEPSIDACVCYAFESSVLQITPEMFSGMLDFDKLNSLAWKIETMSPTDQVKFKAVLEAEQPKDIAEALDAANNLHQYEFSVKPETSDQFFKMYLNHHIDSRFDSEWLGSLYSQNEGEKLLQSLGGAVTDYGVISARGRSLYELVPYGEPQEKELTTQSLTDEKLEVVEVLGQAALFTNGRVTEQELPNGLYKYDLREGESIAFASIEPSVAVNHGGTVLLKAPLDFGDAGYFAFDDDSSPNFLGYHLTPQEFMETDFTEKEDSDETIDEMELRGMQL